MAIGQRADVRIELGRRENVLRAPTRMCVLHHDEADPFVYVDSGGKIAIVRPRFGLTGEDHVEVLEGLVEGDRLLGAPKPGAPLVGRAPWVTAVSP